MLLQWIQIGKKKTKLFNDVRNVDEMITEKTQNVTLTNNLNPILEKQNPRCIDWGKMRFTVVQKEKYYNN